MSSNAAVCKLVQYPNPAAHRVVVSFELPEAAETIARVVDSSGRRLAALRSGRFDRGRHHLELETSSFAAGVYWLEIVAGTTTTSRAFTVIR